MARFVASASVSIGRVRACQIGSVLPSATASLDDHVDRVAVLGVHHDERAGLGGGLHRLEERLVVDHDGALVGHEELVGGDALVGQLGEVFERAARRAGR